MKTIWPWKILIKDKTFAICPCVTFWDFFSIYRPALSAVKLKDLSKELEIKPEFIHSFLGLS